MKTGSDRDDREELAAWLRLTTTPGLGLAAVRRLLAALGSPQAACSAGPEAWRELLKPAELQALAQPADGLPALIERTCAWLDAAPDRHWLGLGDPRYPEGLLRMSDPPLLLYAWGQLPYLAQPALSIVGSRHPTPQGEDHARAFARSLSQAGWTVVSGLALGIDGAAHQGALDGVGGTIAVVGTGLDQVYPRRHQGLAQKIVAHGLLLSEYPLGTPPLAQNFPRRNRIIAGLGQGTLVVEAALQSGSLITARLASELGREVFAIPGSIHAPQSRGCHALIRQGAKLVETVTDILEELPGAAQAVPIQTPLGLDSAASPADVGAAPAAGDADDVLEAMGYDPVALDALCARTGRDPADLSVRLLNLELEGRVARLPGQLFQRRTNS